MFIFPFFVFLPLPPTCFLLLFITFHFLREHPPRELRFFDFFSLLLGVRGRGGGVLCRGGESGGMIDDTGSEGESGGMIDDTGRDGEEENTVENDVQFLVNFVRHEKDGCK